MKDSEFIELLNLYLDHEITPADAARLEAEVQSNAARRRVYQQYCRMQKGCKMLAEDFASQAVPDDTTFAVAQGRTANVGRIHPFYFAGAFVAAAACIAVVFVSRSGVPSSSKNSEAVVAESAVAGSAVATKHLVADTSSAPSSSTERPRTSGLSLRSDVQAASFALSPVGQSDPHFAWMQDVRLTPVQVQSPTSQLRFEISPQTRTENRTYSSDKPLPPDRWVAIRFQK